jgi:hypothetical protein
LRTSLHRSHTYLTVKRSFLCLSHFVSHQRHTVEKKEVPNFVYDIDRIENNACNNSLLPRERLYWVFT